MTSRLYWIGQYEGYAKKLEWFFQFDLAPLIGYCAKLVIGEGEHLCAFLAGIDVNERKYSRGNAFLP
jgi:hypothetical protein